MTQQEVFDNNLIAIFDWWIKNGNRFEKYWTYTDDDGSLHEASHSVKNTEFKYNENWNLLIPVLKKSKQKIKEAVYGTQTETDANKRLGAELNEVYNLNIINAHYCLARFIEWFNQNKEWKQ